MTQGRFTDYPSTAHCHANMYQTWGTIDLGERNICSVYEENRREPVANIAMKFVELSLASKMLGSANIKRFFVVNS